MSTQVSERKVMHDEFANVSEKCYKPCRCNLSGFHQRIYTAPHKRLMVKLGSMKIYKSIAVWFENWLSEIEQMVVLRGTPSE